ncbi:MAG: hypothetical protein ACLFPF_10920 [Halanaerobiales bacterium]
MKEIRGNYTCPECGSLLRTKTVNEDTDADGNRGRKVIYVFCSNDDCDFEKAI